VTAEVTPLHQDLRTRLANRRGAILADVFYSLIVAYAAFMPCKTMENLIEIKTECCEECHTRAEIFVRQLCACSADAAEVIHFSAVSRGVVQQAVALDQFACTEVFIVVVVVVS